MEPKQMGPGGNLERPPAQTGDLYSAPSGEQLSQGFEVAQDNRPEVGAVQAEVAQIAMPALPTPVVTTDDSGASTDDASLLIADDVDLIEKEWVDKAKKILAETKDDPHRREREISKLQVEYIRKRYGRVIGDAGD